uniref:Uncharacterized protein n=1 Tax=Avena sativa TaxID=4498 RepID=A0ACD5Y6G6_AVESA
MDSDEDAFEEPVRTSPRFSTKRSPRKKQAEEALTSCSHGSRIPKKRKTDQNVDRKFTKQKQKVGFKCAPHMLHELFRKLNDEQRIWVEEIGFGSLMNMPCCRLPKGLTVWLINQVSWKRKALIVGGRTIQIKNLVKEMLGIPDGPIPVPLVRSKRGKSKCTNPPGDDRELKDQKAGRGLSCKSTYDSLIGTNGPVQFKRDFMLYVLCIYFAPSSGHFINRSYCPVLSQVDHIKDMNWCDHVAEFLFEGI